MSERILHGPGDLTGFFEDRCKGRRDWRIGVEHEKFAFRLEGHAPAPYRGRESSVAALLGDLVERDGWAPVRRGADLVGCRDAGRAVSLEPGGQVEFAGAPHRRLGALADELHAHSRRLRALADAQGLGLLPLGFAPEWPRARMPRVPGQRFDVMARHMPRVGTHGLDMMQRTCSVQTSLDYSDERDMVRKLRVGLGLGPLLTALAASSPFAEGRPAAQRSHRAWVWARTDPARCGIPEFVFTPEMGFERYARWVCSVPVYSLERGGEHLDLTDRTFADLLAGRRPPEVGRITERDFALQLNAMSPEARLKDVIELRGADSGDDDTCVAVAGFWTALLYDRTALDACHDRVMGWTPVVRQAFWRDAARDGLDARVGAETVRELAGWTLDLAAGALERLEGPGAARHLDALMHRADRGRTTADALLEAWRGAWRGRFEPLYERCRL